MSIATTKINFKLAWKVLTHRISDKESCNCFGIGSSIKCFFLTDTSKVAAHYIPNCVATGFSCSETYFNQASHHLAHIFQLYPVKLNVLASGDMSRADRECLRQTCNRPKLFWTNFTTRNFDSNHAIIHLQSRTIGTML